MKIQDKNLRVIEHLKTKFNFTRNELTILEKSKNFINSIAFTTDGGFDSDTGEFHSEERKINYKIRIVFNKKLAKYGKFICLHPTNGTAIE